MPAIPRLGFAVVDVRDVASLHIRAMGAPEAAGQRFLGTGTFLWMADIADILREELGARASKVPTRPAPDLLIRLVSLFDPSVRRSSASSGSGATTPLRRPGRCWAGLSGRSVRPYSTAPPASSASRPQLASGPQLVAAA
ncbi:MAG: hypothetical protein ACRDN0_13425 [Trebonia sp.]